MREIAIGLASEVQRKLGHTRVTLTVRYGDPDATGGAGGDPGCNS